MNPFSSWDRRRLIAMALWIVLMALATLFYLRDRAIADLQQELRSIQVQQARLSEENQRLRALLARKDDLGYLEYLARRELGLIQPGEEKYILVEREP
jgi:cell division protein FtsB